VIGSVAEYSGLWGSLFMPLVGAAIGEYVAVRSRVAPAIRHRDLDRPLLGAAAKSRSCSR
jgi:hypothetical protein